MKIIGKILVSILIVAVIVVATLFIGAMIAGFPSIGALVDYLVEQVTASVVFIKIL